MQHVESAPAQMRASAKMNVHPVKKPVNSSISKETMIKAIEDGRWQDVTKYLSRSPSLAKDRAVFQAAVTEGGLDILKVFVAKGSNIRATDGYSENALFWIAHRGPQTCEKASYLISKGLKPDEKVLSHAVGLNEPRYVDTLLKKAKLDVNRKVFRGDYSISDRSWKAPLHVAAHYDNLPMVRLLVAKGADITAKDSEGHTPLYHSFWNESGDPKFPVATYLAELGADPNSNLGHGLTPLHFAAKAGSLDLVKLLLSKGAVEKTDEEGKTPQDYATAAGNQPIVDLLTEQ